MYSAVNASIQVFEKVQVVRYGLISYYMCLYVALLSKEWHSRISGEIFVKYFNFLGVGSLFAFLFPGALHCNATTDGVQPHPAVAVVPHPPVTHKPHNYVQNAWLYEAYTYG